MKKVLLSIAIFTLSFVAFGQQLIHLENINTKGASRILFVPGSDVAKMQQHFTLGFTVDVNNQFKIVSIMRTGSKFNGNWDNIIDFNNPGINYFPSLAFRNLYLQTSSNGVTHQLGALPVNNGIRQGTSLSNTGWIDGYRAKINDGYGSTGTITIGYLGNPTTPNLFNRSYNDHENIYFEFTVNGKVFKDIAMQSGLIVNGNAGFPYLAIDESITILGDKVLDIVSDGMIRIDNNSDGNDLGIKTSIGIKTDISDMILNRSGVKLSAYYLYMSNMGDFGTTFATPYDTQNGHNAVFKLSGNLFKKYNSSWFVQARINENSAKNFYLGGISVKLNKK